MSVQQTSDASLLPTLLLAAFIVLKLTGVIEWSWWWVLSPLWITAGIIVIILAIFIPLVLCRR